MTVNQLDLRDIQIQANPPMTARYFALQYKDTNETQVVLYWYETATFNTNSTAQTKSVMTSLIMYPSSPQNVSDTEAQELPFANAINNYWIPIQTWSTIALSISQNGLALSADAAAILVFILIITNYPNLLILIMAAASSLIFYGAEFSRVSENQTFQVFRRLCILVGVSAVAWAQAWLMYNEFAIGLTVSSYIFATILMILLVSAAAAIIIKQPRVITGKEQLTQLQNP